MAATRTKRRPGVRRDGAAIITLRADLKACNEHVKRLDKKVERLTDTVAELHQRIRS
jgi:Cys-tRNA synthase (O-phospho-L-seryl-tRNA:Cys-tRNA synthase)